MSDHKRKYDAKRQGRAYRQWYKTPRWQRRRRACIAVDPWCRMHLAQGIRVPSTTADHVEPHRGDHHKFWHGELQGLCKDCHDRWKQIEEREGFARGVGPDGFPLDPRHPFAS